MLTLGDLLFGLLLPGLVGVALFFVHLRRPRYGAMDRTRNEASGAIPGALALGYAAGNAGLFGAPRFPPVEAIEVVFEAALVMLILTPVPKLVWRWQWSLL